MTEKYTSLKFRVMRTKSYAVPIVIEQEDGVTLANAQHAILMKVAEIPAERWSLMPEEKITVTLTDAVPVKEED